MLAKFDVALRWLPLWSWLLEAYAAALGLCKRIASWIICSPISRTGYFPTHFRHLTAAAIHTLATASEHPPDDEEATAPPGEEDPTHESTWCRVVSKLVKRSASFSPAASKLLENASASAAAALAPPGVRPSDSSLALALACADAVARTRGLPPAASAVSDPLSSSSSSTLPWSSVLLLLFLSSSSPSSLFASSVPAAMARLASSSSLGVCRQTALSHSSAASASGLSWSKGKRYALLPRASRSPMPISRVFSLPVHRQRSPTSPQNRHTAIWSAFP
mmetsp:Transcript_58393/g.114758  ORF Transcript_58393/g.114758 Transcript_58393/m.114758 type:complete len:277 (-) Transcript_58393:192-1022(-)